MRVRILRESLLRVRRNSRPLPKRTMQACQRPAIQPNSPRFSLPASKKTGCPRGKCLPKSGNSTVPLRRGRARLAARDCSETSAKARVSFCLFTDSEELNDADARKGRDRKLARTKRQAMIWQLVEFPSISWWCRIASSRSAVSFGHDLCDQGQLRATSTG